MNKPAVQVRKGDVRHDADGKLHRVVNCTADSDGRVTITYKVHRLSGATELRREVHPADQQTDFSAPPEQPHADEFESA